MSRGLAAGFKRALGGDVVYPAMFVEFEFDSGTTRFWTGEKSITADLGSGVETWIGGGLLGGIEIMGESEDIQARRVVFTLNGVDQSYYATAMSTDFRGRPVRIWFALMDVYGNTVSVNEASGTYTNPFSLLNGFVSTDNASVLWTTSSGGAYVQLRTDATTVYVPTVGDVLRVDLNSNVPTGSVTVDIRNGTATTISESGPQAITESGLQYFDFTIATTSANPVLSFSSNSGAITMTSIDVTLISSTNTVDYYYLLDEARMDKLSMADDGTAITLTLECESALVDMFKGRAAWMNSDTHNKVFPNDPFYEYTPTMPNKKMPWGLKVESSGGGNYGGTIYNTGDYPGRELGG